MLFKTVSIHRKITIERGSNTEVNVEESQSSFLKERVKKSNLKCFSKTESTRRETLPSKRAKEANLKCFPKL
jgi:hypothetical protein